jgi:16S rRNA processing protein RimM
MWKKSRIANTSRPAKSVPTTPSDLNAGRIVGVFGLRGECKVDATRLGTDALRPGSVVRVRLADGVERDLRVRSARLHKGRPLAAFDGFDDPSAAETLVGATLALDRSDVVLSAGEYLDADLVGCAIVDSEGTRLGDVMAVEHYPSQDMLVVGTARALVPMVAAFVRSIDVVRKSIVVDLPPGLLDDREADQG